MLLNLTINNIAVIEKADVDFSDGFNILTGETGAGKSLLIDSLSMVLGMRTSKDLIRAGAPFASVTALFSSSLDLSEFEIENEEDNSVILSRKLYADGRNVCRINSQTVNLTTLRNVGERLVAIHGQHDNIALFKSAYHLSLLDEYGKTLPLLHEYKEAYRKSEKCDESLGAMQLSEKERDMRKAALSVCIEEVKAVSPRIGEDEELASRRDALRNYSAVMANLENISGSLSGQGNAGDCLYTAMHSADTAALMDTSLASIKEKITDLYYECEDIASSVAGIISRMSFSPAELDEIEERLDCITRLKKKYGGSIEDILAELSVWEEEYGSLLFYSDNISRMEEEARIARGEMLKKGEALHFARLKAAQQLSSIVEEELYFLNMPKVSFTVSFREHAPSPSGLFDAEFLISTSPAEAPKPLNRIASGGEMSRIMLALKSALIDCSDVNVLIFDEIDAGVSGNAAVKIAQKLRTLSSHHQIICISHLPQMAARAHAHFLISKDTSTDSFRTDVTLLDFEGRISELTRLISGEGASSAARLAAEEMLKEGGM